MSNYVQALRLPDSLPRVRGVMNKRQQSGQETTTAATFWVHFWVLFLESVISESVSGNLQFFSVGNFDCGWCNPMFVEEYRGWFTFPRASKFNAEVSVCCRSLLVVPFQRQVIWQAVGQGPPNIDPKFKGHAVPKARRQNRSIVKKVCALLTHANLFGILKLEPKIEIQVGSAARSISLHFVAYSPLPS